MVCIAAFIILCIVGIVVAFLSIFKKEIGKKYFAVFKKAWHCVFKKVRLQKCDTNFKDDVKNTILKKVILKKPKLVKPLSIIIEIISVLIVLITVWSIVIAIKSLLALWVFGTCNVSKPSACSLTSEACSIDMEEPKNIFEQIGRNIGEWGEIFGGIPDRLKAWSIDDIDGIDYKINVNNVKADKKAVDIIDPGCIVCMKSYRNQLESGFFDEYETYLVIYPIKTSDNSYKFKNSYIASKYLIAVDIVLGTDENYSGKIIKKLFTESDEKEVNWQTRLNNDLNEEETINLFSSWLKEFNVEKKDIEKVEEELGTKEVDDILEKNKTIIDEKIKVKSIPTLIYDNKKHAGLYKN